MVADYFRVLRDSREVQTPSHLKESTSHRPIRAIHSLFSPSQGQQCSFPFSGSYPVTITDSSGHSDTSEVFRLLYPRYLGLTYLHCFRRITGTHFKVKRMSITSNVILEILRSLIWGKKEKLLAQSTGASFLQFCDLLTGKPIKKINKIMHVVKDWNFRFIDKTVLTLKSFPEKIKCGEMCLFTAV